MGGEAESGAGSFQFSGNPADGISLEEADKALLKELEKTVNCPVPEEELQKVKNKYESAFLFRNTNCQHIASQLCWYEALGDANDYFNDFEKTKAVTAKDIQAMAAQVFRQEYCTTLYYRKLNKIKILFLFPQFFKFIVGDRARFFLDTPIIITNFFRWDQEFFREHDI